MAVPFIRVIVKKIKDEAFKFNDPNDPLLLVILSQNLIDGKYKTGKINLMNTNGEAVYGEDGIGQGHWHMQVDARVTDPDRRFQFLLISQSVFNGLCPAQEMNPLSTNCVGDIYNDLESYSDWQYEETLKNLSLYCRSNKLNDINGKIANMRNTAGEKVELSFNVQLLNTGDPDQASQYMKDHIWKDGKGHEDDTNTMGINPKRHNIKDKGKARVINKRNHVFMLHYFSDPRNCSVCGKFCWGIAKAQAYKCSKCGLVVHGSCISKLAATCTAIEDDPVYQIPSGQGVINVSHNLKSTTNWSLKVKKCAHSGRFIYPFTSYQICRNCGKAYKLMDNESPTANCGVDEYALYYKLKDIDAIRAEAQNERPAFGNSSTGNNNAVETIYGTVPISKSDQRADAIAGLAHSTDAILNKIPNRDKTIMRDIDNHRKKSLKRIKESKFNEFKIFNVLGEGSFGKVLLAKYKDCKSDKYLAIKAIRKDVTLENYDMEAAHLERDCLKLRHPFILGGICTFHDPNYLYYVMELLTGGDLMALVLKTQDSEGKNRVKEKIVRTFGVEILLGLRFLHRNQILYRDLKLDNVMIGPDGHVRIADFGMVKMNVTANNLATTFCGTPDYMAPEILQQSPYGFKVDLWAWAVVVFELIEGFSPFQGKTEQALFHEIKFKNPRFKYSQKLSSNLKDLMVKIFEKQPDRRISLDAALKHPWITEKFSNVEDIEALKYPPGMEAPPKDKNSFLSKFDPDNLSASTNLTSSPSLRAIGEREDLIFKEFSWMDEGKVKHFRT